MKRIVLSMLILAAGAGLASAQDVLPQARHRAPGQVVYVEGAGASPYRSDGNVAFAGGRDEGASRQILMSGGNAKIAARGSGVVGREEGRTGRAQRRQINDRVRVR
jgi:hypothetical protein